MEMTFEAVRQYCLSKQGAFEDYPFGPEPLAIKVGSKIFALISVKNGKLNLSLRCDPFVAEDLRQQYRAVTPDHLNKKNWNSVVVDEAIADQELIWMIDHSYELVSKSINKT